METKHTVKRDAYKAIVISSLSARLQAEVSNLVQLATNSRKIDEHGNWNFGADFDKKGRGSALNWDLYGIGRDIHSKVRLIVIQVRQYVKRRKNYWPDVRKSYFLIGRNEDKTVFAHPVQSKTVHAAIDSNKDVVKACQDWIFQADYAKVKRHGDVAAIPARKPRGTEVGATQILIQPQDGSAGHWLETERIVTSENCIYAYNIHLKHMPGTHPDVIAPGWHRIVVGRRGNFYDFAAPTID